MWRKTTTSGENLQRAHVTMPAAYVNVVVRCIASVDANLRHATRKIVVQMKHESVQAWPPECSVSTAILTHSTHNQSLNKQNVVSKTSKGRCAMARLDSSYLPRGNPCAQCGKPIPRPDWVESSPGRTSFLWFCRACDYRFEAIAIYEEADPDALAA
jgi:hypothetical protein